MTNDGLYFQQPLSWTGESQECINDASNIAGGPKYAFTLDQCAWCRSEAAELTAENGLFKLAALLCVQDHYQNTSNPSSHFEHFSVGVSEMVQVVPLQPTDAEACWKTDSQPAAESSLARLSEPCGDAENPQCSWNFLFCVKNEADNIETDDIACWIDPRKAKVGDASAVRNEVCGDKAARCSWQPLVCLLGEKGYQHAGGDQAPVTSTQACWQDPADVKRAHIEAKRLMPCGTTGEPACRWGVALKTIHTASVEQRPDAAGSSGLLLILLVVFLLLLTGALAITRSTQRG